MRKTNPSHHSSLVPEENRGDRQARDPNRARRVGRSALQHAAASSPKGHESELGAAMLLAETGLDDPALHDNSAAYVQSWLGALRNDRNLVISASSQAYKAVELIANVYENEPADRP